MIALQLAKTLKRIRQAELDYHRPPGVVRLLAVSKGRNIQMIQAAAMAGQCIFGENYLQEAIEKMQSLAALKLEWHFIGTLQANKTRAVAQHFQWVHSVNRYKIAQRLSQQRPADWPPLNVCLEVNINHESTKSGADADEIADLAAAVRDLPGLRLRGLMAIPKAVSGFQQQLLIYKKIYNLQQELIAQGFFLDTLSMGMSNDFEAAIAAGATLVRIGAAIFQEER